MPPKRQATEGNSNGSTVLMKDNSQATPFEFKLKNDFPALYRQANAEQRSELFSQVSIEENKYREIFAQDRNSSLIADPHVMLLDVHKEYDIFKNEEQTESEKKIPRVFESSTTATSKSSIENSVVSHQDFLKNFAVFTEDSLRYINWYLRKSLVLFNT